MAAMTMRDRMLALILGREHDRVPFVQYSGLAGPDQEIWDLLSRENMGLLRWVAVHRCETPNCRFESEEIVRDGKRGFRRTLTTPAGQLSEERLYEPTYGTSAAGSHFIKEPGDYAILMAYLRDIRVVKDLGPFLDTVRAVGQDGLPHTAVMRTPFQQLWIEWVDIRDLAVHLVECTDLMAEIIGMMRQVQRRIFEAVCRAAREAPIPYVVFPDNITAPMIGETYFRRYCVPSYVELANLLAEIGEDVPIFVHMDGDLKALWEAIGDSPVRGLDSMSPPPDNDTSVAEALRRWPHMRVCINFPSSVHLRPPDDVYAHTMRILEEGGRRGRLQIQISENVPPGLWKNSFPQIVRAIADFGPACGA